jgi:hypothetical protein
MMAFMQEACPAIVVAQVRNPTRQRDTEPLGRTSELQQTWLTFRVSLTTGRQWEADPAIGEAPCRRCGGQA